MHDFDFLRPANLAEALASLAQFGDEACAFAGGTALLLGMRQRLLSPRHLVCLDRVPELKGISFDATSGLSIGAMSRHCDVAQSEAVRQHYPALAEMAGRLANPQVRNQGTIGGNLCYADPSTDPPACLVALGARVVLASAAAERTLPIEDFLVDYFTTALEPGEILVRLVIPPLPAGSLALYRRHLRTTAEPRPVANVANQTSTLGADIRLVVGAAAPVAQRMREAEAYLRGNVLSLTSARTAADLAAEELNPISDGRGDGEFRRAIVRALVFRILAEAGALEEREAPCEFA